MQCLIKGTHSVALIISLQSCIKLGARIICKELLKRRKLITRARQSKIIKGVQLTHRLTKREKVRKEYVLSHVGASGLNKRKRRKPFCFSSGSSATEIGFPHRSRICFSFECALFYYADVCRQRRTLALFIASSTQKSARSLSHTHEVGNFRVHANRSILGAKRAAQHKARW